MEQMFLRAAMNLPKNFLLGTDAGIWSGVKVECEQAMEVRARLVHSLDPHDRLDSIRHQSMMTMMIIMIMTHES